MKVVFKLITFASIIKHHVLSRIILNMALLLRVVNESENVVFNQVVEEVNPSVEVGFDICETTPEPDFSDNKASLGCI